MTVAVDLDPQTEELLRKAASLEGVELDVYLQSLIKRDVRRRSLDEQLEPLRRTVSESGISEEELDTFMNGVLRQVRKERSDARRED
ncbi:MAG: hypothetical protein AB7F88_12840 [Pyrinomonadaceae bacterium]